MDGEEVVMAAVVGGEVMESIRSIVLKQVRERLGWADTTFVEFEPCTLENPIRSPLAGCRRAKWVKDHRVSVIEGVEGWVQNRRVICKICAAATRKRNGNNWNLKTSSYCIIQDTAAFPLNYHVVCTLGYSFELM